MLILLWCGQIQMGLAYNAFSHPQELGVTLGSNQKCRDVSVRGAAGLVCSHGFKGTVWLCQWQGALALLLGVYFTDRWTTLSACENGREERGTSQIRISLNRFVVQDDLSKCEVYTSEWQHSNLKNKSRRSRGNQKCPYLF